MARSWIRSVASTAVLLGGCVATSLAGVVYPGQNVVYPGQTVVINSSDYATPQGTVVAETVLPFSIEYGPITGEFVEFPGTLKGTLTNTVVRDQELGTLVFLYDIDIAYNGDADASAASILTVGGFGQFGADISGSLDDESVVLGQRTNDGSDIKLLSDDPGLGGAPRLVVRTDAVDFAANGTTRFLAGDDLAVLSPDGWEMSFASGTAIIPGTFQPALAPTPIPLPPSVWTGLFGVVAAVSASHLIRRRAILHA